MSSTTSTPNEQQWANLDLRSLALFRMGIGVVLLLDTLARIPDITSFYTDSGMLPRELLTQSGLADSWLCLHLGGGGWWSQFILLLVQAGFALGLVLGWRTRLMILGSWVLHNSLLLRNPFVNDRGDLQLALMLFWAFFLPLGARWSMDQKSGRPSTGSNHGLPAAALILQFVQIYLCTALLKYGEFWLVRGDGFFHSLQSPLFSNSLSLWMSRWPPLILKILNYAVIAGELFAGILLLCPVSVGMVRGVAFVLLFLFHGSVFFLFDLGIFPLIGLVSLMALLPSSFWNLSFARRFSEWLSSRSSSKLDEEFCLPSLSKAILVVSIVLVFLSNLVARPSGDAFALPSLLKTMTKILRLEQHWDLFSPIPPYNGRFVLRDISSGESLYSCPSSADDMKSHGFRNHRWKMAMISSLFPKGRVLRSGLAKSLLLGKQASDPLQYEFVVRLVQRNGDLAEPKTWVLWTEKIQNPL